MQISQDRPDDSQMGLQWLLFIYNRMDRSSLSRLYKAQKLKNSISADIPFVLKKQLKTIQQAIRQQQSSFFQKWLCCSHNSQQKTDKDLLRGIQTLDQSEKVIFYDQMVENINKQLKEKYTIIDQLPYDVQISLFQGVGCWQDDYLRIDGFNMDFGSGLTLDSRDYLLRKSKKTIRECYVFQTIRDKKPHNVHFSFEADAQTNYYLTKLKKTLKNAQDYIISQEISIAGLWQKKVPTDLSITHLPESARSINLLEKTSSKLKQAPYDELRPVDSVEELSILQCFNKAKQTLNSARYKQLAKCQSAIPQTSLARSERQLREITSNQTLMSWILPQNSLTELNDYDGYELAYNNKANELSIWSHKTKLTNYKISLTTQVNWISLGFMFADNMLSQYWNYSLAQSSVLTSLASESSELIYLRFHCLNLNEQSRDILLLRHVDFQSDSITIVDKSIVDATFPPKGKTHRIRVDSSVTQVQQSKDLTSFNQHLVIDFGYQDHRKNRQHALQYLKAYQNLQKYCLNFKLPLSIKIRLNIQLDWREESKGFPENNVSSQEKLRPLECVSQEQQFDERDFYQTVQNNVTESIYSEHCQTVRHLVSSPAQNLQALVSEVELIQLNSEGHCILPKEFLKIKHPMDSLQSSHQLRPKIFENYLLNNDYELESSGYMRLINPQKIAAQDGVISFVMSKLRKFITAGGRINIQLPVTVFSCQSNLQRLCTMLGLAPIFLEQAVKISNPVERMKHQIVFGLSNIILYFQIEKPFNPILGQTYQGFIDNCPVFAEQISHHPPISSLLMQGRGYRISTSLESTLSISLNSVRGLNLGLTTVKYANGQEFKYHACPGELSGLTIGDRRCRCLGKSHYFDEKNLLFCELNHSDPSGFFSGSKWKYVDQIEGTLVKVTSDFMRRFLESYRNNPLDEKPSPEPSDIVAKYFTVGGRWLSQVTYDGEVFYDVPNMIPFPVIDFAYPLNSNSNYREDIFYRKLVNKERSQVEKERLENVQRADKKLREKYGPQKL